MEPFIQYAVLAVLWALVAAIFKYIERKKEWGERFLVIASLWMVFASAWSIFGELMPAVSTYLVDVGVVLGFIFAFIGALIAMYEEFA